MYLKDLIEWLESKPEDMVMSQGLGGPTSWRGSYSELAFIPSPDPQSIGQMLEAARSAHGQTFTGYKGGDYTMGDYSDVHLAAWGEIGRPITADTLELWSGRTVGMTSEAWRDGWPLEGRRVLVSHRARTVHRGIGEVVLSEVVIAFHDGGTWIFDDGDVETCGPLPWMPLPESVGDDR